MLMFVVLALASELWWVWGQGAFSRRYVFVSRITCSESKVKTRIDRQEVC